MLVDSKKSLSTVWRTRAWIFEQFNLTFNTKYTLCDGEELLPPRPVPTP